MRLKSARQEALLALAVLLSANLSPAADFRLTERVVIDRIVSQSREGKLAQIEAALARNEVLRAKSPYENRLVFEANHQRDQSDRVTSVFGTKVDTSNFNAKYQRTFSTGTQFEAAYLNSRVSSDSPFVTLNPAWNSALAFSLRQPVLRDAFGYNLRTNVEFAEIQAERADALTARQLEALALAAVNTYWNWVASMKQREKAQAAVERAKEFERITRNKSRLGIAEATDRYAAKANLSAREQELLVVEELNNTLLIQLKNLLLLEPSDSCKPGETFVRAADVEPLEEYLGRAKNNRTDLKAAEKNVESRERWVKSKRLSALPALDLLTSLQINAVRNEGHEAAFETFYSDKPLWFVGGELTFPLDNRALRADLRQAELEERRAVLEFEELQDQVSTETRVAWEQFSSTVRRASKGRETVELERKKLKAAERDFQRGRLDALNVIIYQQDLLRAETNLVRILAEQAVARAALNNATGRLRVFNP